MPKENRFDYTMKFDVKAEEEITEARAVLYAV